MRGRSRTDRRGELWGRPMSSSGRLSAEMMMIHMNLTVKSLYLLKNLHQNPLRSFKDLSIQRERQRKATSFYYVMAIPKTALSAREGKGFDTLRTSTMKFS
jgi:hypothetical protein